jgi:predicted metal-dependent phosphoesterase TrpH
MPRDRRAPAIGRLVPPTPSRADFHAHTNRSDGLLEPSDLVAAAAAAGVHTLAVTDHDTLAGYRALLAPGAGPLPAALTVIPGVEINATAREIPELLDGELHLVGLGVDPANEAFDRLLDRQRAARRRRFELMTTRLRDAGMPVDDQLADLDRGDDEALGRPTIARALVAAGHAVDVQDAFARIVGHGKPGYVRREGIGPREALAAIRAAGGLPILAHFAAAPRCPGLVRELTEDGLGGIEVHHRSFDAATVAAMAAFAAAGRLVPSGGTDFHGDEGSYADAIGETWVPDDVADAVTEALSGRPLEPLPAAPVEARP